MGECGDALDAVCWSAPALRAGAAVHAASGVGEYAPHFLLSWQKKTCRARYKRKPPFARLLVRPVKTGLGSSSCAEPLALSERSRRICDIGCRLEGAKRTRGPSCAAAARPGIRRSFLPAGVQALFFYPLSGSGAVVQSSPICTNRLFETAQMRRKRHGRSRH